MSPPYYPSSYGLDTCTMSQIDRHKSIHPIIIPQKNIDTNPA